MAVAPLDDGRRVAGVVRAVGVLRPVCVVMAAERVGAVRRLGEDAAVPAPAPVVRRPGLAVAEPDVGVVRRAGAKLPTPRRTGVWPASRDEARTGWARRVGCVRDE